jgi:hypothetical protein
VRFYGVPVYLNQVTMLGIDWELDAVLVIEKWVSFQFTTGVELEKECELAGPSSASPARPPPSSPSAYREPMFGPTVGPTFSALTCNAMGHVETPKLLWWLESAETYRGLYRFPKLTPLAVDKLDRLQIYPQCILCSSSQQRRSRCERGARPRAVQRLHVLAGIGPT